MRIIQHGELLSDTICYHGRFFAYGTITNQATYVYIFFSTFFSVLIRQQGGTDWIRISRLFINENARSRNDGFYLLPSFHGSLRTGHWFLNLVHIHHNGQAVGYTIDSLGTS